MKTRQNAIEEITKELPPKTQAAFVNASKDEEKPLYFALEDVLGDTIELECYKKAVELANEFDS